jgi:hypothetical protein
MDQETQRQYTRPYVRINPNESREVFRAVSVPNAARHTSHGDVIGPFKTTRGAQYVQQNPTFVGTVAQAERAASY